MIDLDNCSSLLKLNNFKLPYGLIRKDIIVKFLDLNRVNYSDEEMIFLKKLTVDKWRYVAKKKIDTSYWHNINSFFNEDKYYDLFDIAEKILELQDEIDFEYENYKKNRH